jgi:hypothetical protein
MMNGDDCISFLGRDDDVIRSSGYRISLGEIEDCLIQEFVKHYPCELALLVKVRSLATKYRASLLRSTLAIIGATPTSRRRNSSAGDKDVSGSQ